MERCKCIIDGLPWSPSSYSLIMTSTSATKIRRYSQELSAYTLRQFCLASAVLNTNPERVRQLSAAVAQADRLAYDLLGSNKPTASRTVADK